MSCTETIYIESATGLEDEISRYNQIITALQLRAVEGAAISDKQQYSIDDGQVKISTLYRDPVSIAKAIKGYKALLEEALNKLNGRSFVARNWRGLV